MAIEVLDDIVEEIMDRLGIYGAHDSASCQYKECRSCAASGLKDRINKAVEVERKLKV
jgi:hypothetical protein